jgi:hypothetical protein
MKKLPKEIIHTATKKKLTTVISTFLILVFAFNWCAIAYLRHYNPKEWNFLSHLKWGILQDLEKEGIEWLIIGDSSGNQGIDPKHFKQRLNQSAINLCTIGPLLTLDGSWMLDYHIKEYGAPKNVLMIHVPDLWYREFDENVFCEAPWDLISANDLSPQLDYSLEQESNIFVNRFFPLYSKNLSLAKIFTGEVQLFSPPVVVDSLGYNQREGHNKDNVAKDTKGHREFFGDNNLEVSYYVEQGLISTMENCEKHGVNLFIAMAPIHDTLGYSPEFKGYQSQINEYLVKMSSKYKRTHIISDSTMLFPSDKMQNSDHIIHSESALFTNYLIDRIEKRSKFPLK